MELVQVAQPAAATLLGTGLVLGLRHGFDWDHIAAIFDIAGSTTGTDAGAANGRAGFRRLEGRALWLSLLYALGHAGVVVVLGVAALSFAAILPDWIDPLMERIVGVTLIALGLWVVYSLVRYAQGKEAFQIRSRWMLVFAAVRYLFGRTRHRHGAESLRVDRYGTRSALGVGMIHGIGAETGSQALLIAAVGGAADQGLGIGMLLAFVAGLVLSNTAVAVLAATGFVSSRYVKPFYIAIGALTAAFSLFVGVAFVVGAGAELPDLTALVGGSIPE